MKWIDEIRKVYDKYFKDSFDKLGLKKYEEMDGPGMGALIKFKNDSFRVRMVNDRGLLEMDISQLIGEEQFKGIEILNSFLKLEKEKSIDESERRKILGTRLDYMEQSNFLLNNSARLKDLFNSQNFKDTLKRIDSLGQERFDLSIK
jgi:hypothetical protein